MTSPIIVGLKDKASRRVKNDRMLSCGQERLCRRDIDIPGFTPTLGFVVINIGSSSGRRSSSDVDTHFRNESKRTKNFGSGVGTICPTLKPANGPWCDRNGRANNRETIHKEYLVEHLDDTANPLVSRTQVMRAAALTVRMSATSCRKRDKGSVSITSLDGRAINSDVARVSWIRRIGTNWNRETTIIRTTNDRGTSDIDIALAKMLVNLSPANLETPGNVDHAVNDHGLVIIIGKRRVMRTRILRIVVNNVIAIGVYKKAGIPNDMKTTVDSAIPITISTSKKSSVRGTMTTQVKVGTHPVEPRDPDVIRMQRPDATGHEGCA